MNVKLLTIAIPTWNRAKILEQSLNYLLPQIVKNKDKIELILSDNGSDDNTQEVFQKYITEFNQLDIISYRHNQNTGYYGNFKKCRELSNSRYLWLLSDNEFVCSSIVDYIISILESYDDLGIVYLDEWQSYKHEYPINNKYYSKETTIDELFRDGVGYKLTLISSIIMKNNKINDNEIFNNYNGNAFLGFIFLLNSLKFSKNIVQIDGVSLLNRFVNISADLFEIWTKDISNAINFGLKENVLTDENKNDFYKSVLNNITRWHYLEYKATGELYGRSYKNINEINCKLFFYYNKYPQFQDYIEPIIDKPKFVVFFIYYFSSLFRKSLIRIKKKLNHFIPNTFL